MTLTTKLLILLPTLVISIPMAILLIRTSVLRWRHFRNLQECWPLSHVDFEADPQVDSRWWPKQYPNPQAFAARLENFKTLSLWQIHKAEAAQNEWNSAVHCRLYGRLCQRASFRYSVFGELGTIIGGASFGASISGSSAAMSDPGFPWPLLATYASLAIASVGVFFRLWRTPRWSRVAGAYFTQARHLERSNGILSATSESKLTD